MKRLLLSAALLLTLIIPCRAYFTPALSVVPMRDDMGNVHCSAFSISQSQRLYVTAAHCTVDELRIGNDPQEPAVVSMDTVNDIAVLRAQNPAPALKLADHAPTLGEQVFLYGYALGMEPPTLFRGYVASLGTVIDGWKEGPQQLYDMRIQGGDSGSPILNDKDEIVGIGQFSLSDRTTSMAGGSRWEELSKAIKQALKY